MAQGGGATDEMVTTCLSGDQGLPGGSHGAFHGCRSLCLLGSLSLYRMLKVTFCDCIHIKMNIIRAGFFITYSLLLYFFSSDLKEMKIKAFL